MGSLVAGNCQTICAARDQAITALRDGLSPNRTGRAALEPPAKASHMKWPWVSRRAYETMCDLAEAWIKRHDALMEENKRLQTAILFSGDSTAAQTYKRITNPPTETKPEKREPQTWDEYRIRQEAGEELDKIFATIDNPTADPFGPLSGMITENNYPKPTPTRTR